MKEVATLPANTCVCKYYELHMHMCAQLCKFICMHYSMQSSSLELVSNLHDFHSQKIQFPLLENWDCIYRLAK